MNFVDSAKIILRAGTGGAGVVSFRHEKYVDKGGPDGGDGGDGGDIAFEASESENTLANFRFQKELIASSGGSGGKRKRHGKNGQNLIIKVPVGTQVSANERVLADLVVAGQTVVLAKGGRGGYGNAHFKSSTRQAPKFAEKGEPGDSITALLELKMIADVGLIGLPNAGKSTLLSRLSNARPEIADYPFTTLKPNLGVVDTGKRGSLLFADIPGLIEGAARGKGLGHEFLRHVERTAVLVHVIDAYQDSLADSYKTIVKELKNYKVDLSSRSQIIAINKTEGLSSSQTQNIIKQLTSLAPKSQIFAISAQSGKNLDKLINAVDLAVQDFRNQEDIADEDDTEDLPTITLSENDNSFKVEKAGKKFIVSGEKIERFAMRTDFDNSEAVQRLKDIMKKTGVTHELLRRGANYGDTIEIGSWHVEL